MTGARSAWLAVACGALSLACCATSLGAEPSPQAPVEPTIGDAERDHWSYRPLATVTPPEVDDSRWNRHPIDRFIKAALDERGVQPLPRVGRATLLRRVYFDLTGLPPTSDEVRAFVSDDSPDAYERLIDRLLESPAYGERWAQHWLDLARFAETDGFEHDHVRPNAWRYRDWVIDALNRDLPFDEFLRLQLAGDLLHPDDPAASIATGFLLCGPDMPDLNLQEERRHLVLNEMASTVGSVFLGLQVGCAQCHDHKWDAITQYDFYRLRAFFEPAEIFRDHPIPTPQQAAAHRAAEEAWTPEQRQRDERRRELEERARKRLREKNPDAQPDLATALDELTDDERAEHAELVEHLRDLPAVPKLPMCRVMREGNASGGHLYVRGDFRRPGPEVEPGYPQVLTSPAGDAHHAEPLTRAALAEWLLQPDHPLTARVVVNRLWQWHFGTGLSATSSDFGIMGDEPTHLELLDWLARHFMAEGWSFKTMHRLLLTSQAYQTASGPFDHEWSADEIETARHLWQQGEASDPNNYLLWRRERLRLDGEAIRDGMLHAAGQLSMRRGGPGIRPPLPPEVTITLLKNQWNVNGDEEDHRRRSIYLFVRRNLRIPLFDVFDRPDTNASCAQRHESTTATQSLVLLNSEFSLARARDLAAALRRAAPGDTARQIDEAYLRVLNRPATDEEVALAEAFLTRQHELLLLEDRGDELAVPSDDTGDDPCTAAALVDFCLALFNTNEFVYLD